MTDLGKILKELKIVPKYRELTFDTIDKALVSKLMIRNRLLSLVYAQLDVLGVTDKPAPIDILSMKPIKVNGEVYSIDGIVAVAFARAVEERDLGFESALDIIKLHKLSHPVDFNGVTDHTALEFLSRIPTHGEVRTIREVKLQKDVRVYFCMNRYMVLINLGSGEAIEDQNYFITIVDLGSMFQNYFNDVESYVLFNPTIIGRLEKIPFTGKPRHVNTKLMLWDTVREPGRYYWFVRGENIKRPNYTFEIVFGKNQQTRYSTLSNDVWAFYIRAFGITIPLSTNARKTA